jgi:ankyrin repeat protein
LTYNKIINVFYENNTINTKLQKAIRNNDITQVSNLLNNNNINASEDDNIAIINASRYGHLDIVKLLLKDPRVNPSDRNNEAIVLAFMNDNKDVSNLLWSDKRVNQLLKENSHHLSEEILAARIHLKIKTF